MKKLFSLMAAVLFAGSMMAEPTFIKFTEPAAAGSLNGQTFGEDFELTITDTGNKVSIDANSCTFGLSAEETVSFTHRLKTGSKSSSANKMTLVVPEEGPLAIYARTGNNSDTTRYFVIANGSDTIVKHICKESDVVEGTNIYLPVIIENVPAGTYELTYPLNSINFYGFEMVLEETEATLTFEVEAGTTTFTVTPSDLEVEYYISVIPSVDEDSVPYTKEVLVALIDGIIDDMGAGLEYFSGVQTQSYEEDWYVDEPGDYLIVVCGINATYDARTSDVVITPFTFGPTTAVEDVKAVKATKVLVNGQIVIIRNGVRYNVAGQLVK